MKVKDLLQECNNVRQALNMEPLKGWKGAKDALIKKIEKLRASLPKAINIGQLVKSELAEVDPETGLGNSYDKILERVKETFPESRTSIKCVWWYAKDMKRRGETLPARPRSKRRAS